MNHMIPVSAGVNPTKEHSLIVIELGRSPNFLWSPGLCGAFPFRATVYLDLLAGNDGLSRPPSPEFWASRHGRRTEGENRAAGACARGGQFGGAAERSGKAGGSDRSPARTGRPPRRGPEEQSPWASWATAAVIALAGCTDIVVYGDSLTVQSTNQIQSNAGGKAVVVHANSGTALCDWVPQMAADRAGEHPKTVVIAFAGERQLSCVADAWAKGGPAAALANFTKLRSEPSGKPTRQNGSLL